MPWRGPLFRRPLKFVAGRDEVWELELLKLFMWLVGSAGFYLLCLDWLDRWLLRWRAQAQAVSPYLVAFAWLLAWPLSLGFRGCLATWFYYAGDTAAHAAHLTNFLGAVFLVYVLRRWRLKAPLNLIPLTEQKRRWWDWLVLALVAVSLYRHFTAVFRPWFDHDEIAVYGYISKLFANGLTYAQSLTKGGPHDGPVLVQTLDGLAYRVFQSTGLVRLGRWINLLVMSGLTYTYLRFLGCKRFWAALAILCICEIPEFRQYLALSLKVDAVVMLFEYAALLILSLGVLRLAPRLQSATFAFLLALMSFSSRMSGLYLLMLTGGFLLWVLVSDAAVLRRHRVWAIGGAVAATIAFLNFVWVHLWIFSNPLFPTQFPFGGGSYAYTLQSYREIYNLVGPEWWWKPFYMLAHLGLGLENREGWDFHAVHRAGSMNWLSPLLLAAPVLVFFWRQRTILLLLALFLYQYVFWYLGIHYSRVFLAGSVLPILAVALLASDLKLKAMQRDWRPPLQGMLGAMMVACGLYFGFIKFFESDFPSDSWRMLYHSHQQNAQVEYVLQRSGEATLPEKDFRDKVSQLFAGHVVSTYVNSYAGRMNHILFRGGGMFMEAPILQAPAEDTPYKKGTNEYSQSIPFMLVNQNFVRERDAAAATYIQAQYPNVCFQSGDGVWLMRARGVCSL